MTHRWARGLRPPLIRGVGIVVALSLLPAGCATEPWELVDVELSVVDSVFTSQVPIQFEITAINRGTEEVRLSSYQCPPTFHVLDASGSVVGPGMRLCTLELREPITLAPGETASYAYRWSGELFTVGGGTNVLPFGDYALRGWVLVLPDHRVHSESVAVRFVDPGGGGGEFR